MPVSQAAQKMTALTSYPRWWK